ncbi:MAG: hypothetical protein LBF54_03750 [Holosporaceae bacterium]|nr:hypothetical protein [Holosporaceae bacterium]
MDSETTKGIKEIIREMGDILQKKETLAREEKARLEQEQRRRAMAQKSWGLFCCLL